MITIDVTPAKRRFGKRPRRQWRFTVTGGNNRTVSDQDTYANTDDIHDVWAAIVAGDEPVRFRVHYSYRVVTTWLRNPPTVEQREGVYAW